MKTKNSLLAVLTLVIGLGTLTSCKKTQVTEKDGIEYTYVKEGSDKASNGDFILYNLVITNAEDSVIYSTLDQPFPGYLMANDSLPAQNGMDEIFLNLKQGDSITFQSTANIIFSGNFPAFLQGEDQLTVKLGAFAVKTEAEMQSYYEEVMMAEQAKSAERAKSLMVEQAATIEAYAAEKGLNAQKTENGLYYVIEQEGTGDAVTPGTTMYVNYAGYLLDGTLFDTSWEEIAKANNVFNEGRPYEPLPVNVGMGQVIPGWDEGLMLLKKGSKGKFLIPSPLAYGEAGAGAMIPGNSILIFDVEVVDVQK
ncbi:FKBP-type peptidyl-prolyl cis-trans isomerase [Algoriphagus confluentis]|uniref:Peptidyl-prolyl cis-trans isomerase n=1 Tax=Algoriphagus confluentis TaxID=1697556 RepID=A0ABQ6PV95_9BACT|nr:hypothetical protein Aconfl_41260 [Algoriphagus confluentis]